MLLTALLVSPVGWQYYVFFSLGPLSTMIYFWRSDSARLISSKDRFLKIGRTVLLYLALPGMLVPFIAIHLFQPNRFATVTLGSIYFWSILCLWTSGILDGFLEKVRLDSNIYEFNPDPSIEGAKDSFPAPFPHPTHIHHEIISSAWNFQQFLPQKSNMHPGFASLHNQQLFKASGERKDWVETFRIRNGWCHLLKINIHKHKMLQK